MTDQLEYETAPEVRLPWEGGPGLAYREALALTREVLAVGARTATRSRFLATAPIDALEISGRRCGMPRWPRESEDAYRARLLNRWGYHRQRGTYDGVENTIADMIQTYSGGASAPRPGVRLREFQSRETARRGDRWLWLVITPPHPFGTLWGWRWGAHAWGTRRWGGEPSDAVTELFPHVRALLRSHVPAHCFIRQIVLVLAGNLNYDTGEPLPGGQAVYLEAHA